MEARALYIGRAILSVELHPFYGNAALEGVTEELNARILRWDDGLNGLLLSYTKLQNMPAQATVRPHFPFIQLKVAADVLVFKPSVGMALSGRVNKLGADFIGYKILGSINGAVGRQNIRKDLEFRPQDGCWASKDDPRSKIGLGSDILFCVHGLQVEGDGVLTVWGSMKEPWTGATRATAFTWPSAFPDQRFTQDEEALPSRTLTPASAAGTSPAGGTLGEGRPADVVSGYVEEAGTSERPAPVAFGAKTGGAMQERSTGPGAAAGGGIPGGGGTTGGNDAVANGGLEGKRKKKRKKGTPGEGLDNAATPSGRADGEDGAGDAAGERGVQAVTADGGKPLPNGGSQHHRKKKEKGGKAPINQIVGEDVKFGLDGDRPKIRKLTKPQSAAWGEFPSGPEQTDTGLVKRKKQKKVGIQTG